MDFKNEFLIDLETLSRNPNMETYVKKEKASELGIKMAEVLGWKESEVDPVHGVKKFTLHLIAVDAKAYYNAIERIKRHLHEGHPVFDILNEMHNPNAMP